MTKTEPDENVLRVLQLMTDRYSAECREKIQRAVKSDFVSVHYQAVFAAFELAHYGRLVIETREILRRRR